MIFKAREVRFLRIAAKWVPINHYWGLQPNYVISVFSYTFDLHFCPTGSFSANQLRVKVDDASSLLRFQYFCLSNVKPQRSAFNTNSYLPQILYKKSYGLFCIRSELWIYYLTIPQSMKLFWKQIQYVFFIQANFYEF